MPSLFNHTRAGLGAATLFFTIACGGRPGSLAPGGGPSETSVVARVGDRDVTLEQVDERALPSNLSAYQAIYQARRSALKELVAEILLDEEARSRGIGRDELVALEIESKVPEVSAEDVEAFYIQNLARLRGQSLEQIGSQIREFLVVRNEAVVRDEYVARLRARTSVAVSLEPPRLSIEVADSERVKGPRDPPVTIVEYSDFQCPFCARVGPVLKQIEAAYGDRVRVVYRDFPLPNHPEAQTAAEAARCAHEQGKFWHYHDRLFESQRSLSPETYRQLAADAGLDSTVFDECLGSGRFRAAIEEDSRSGESMGVSATPSFFINGRHVSGAQPFEVFQEIIEEEIGS